MTIKKPQPCLYCKKPAIPQPIRLDGDPVLYAVACSDIRCGTGPRRPTPAEAIDAWNAPPRRGVAIRTQRTLLN